MGNEAHDNALLAAVMEGQPSRVEELVRLGADVNCRNSDGETPLMLSSARGRIEIVKLLLAHGADLGAVSAAGKIAHSQAAENAQREVVGCLEKWTARTPPKPVRYVPNYWLIHWYFIVSMVFEAILLLLIVGLVVSFGGSALLILGRVSTISVAVFTNAFLSAVLGAIFNRSGKAMLVVYFHVIGAAFMLIPWPR